MARKDAGELRRQVRASTTSTAFSDISTVNADKPLPPLYDHRKKGFPIRTGIAAVTLFTLGSVMIFLSTRIGLDEEHRGLSFLVLGLVAFIPGSYATFQLYGAWKGWHGYDYDQIPSYDD